MGKVTTVMGKIHRAASGRLAATQRECAINQENLGFCSNAIKTSKYTVRPWTVDFFLWKNLFEQFMRLANMYFLVIAILQMIPGISPTGQYTQMATLSFVISVSAVKAAFEDYKRHKSDVHVNNRSAFRLANGKWEEIKWCDVAVGHILRVDKGQEFPADIITLSTSEEEGMAYVETSNLDGETNLKPKRALAETMRSTVSQLSKLAGTADYELPNKDLYTFTGTLKLTGGPQIPLGPDALLLRGSQLRKATWITGLVIFTGPETKMMQNAMHHPHKRSQLERNTNSMLVMVLLYQIALVLLCSILITLRDTSRDWYLSFNPLKGMQFLQSIPTFLILYHNVIPISLYVSVELVKVAQGLLIHTDLEMYYAPKDMPAMPHTTDLNEELGQVTQVFSDKTGTLTCNVMSFFKFSVGGRTYGHGTTEIGKAAARRLGTTVVDDRPSKVVGAKVQFWDPLVSGGAWRRLKDAALIEDFFTLLAICHTVIIEKEDDGTFKLQAESPDEAALVEAAYEFDFKFMARKAAGACVVSLMGVEKVYTVLNVLEFSSDRKRMSVVCRTPEGAVVLYCKGADNTLFERMAPGAPHLEATAGHLKAYGDEGLRTLVCAKAVLDPAVYAPWDRRFAEARQLIGDRRGPALAALAEELEQDLEFVGATAIEDKLQESVPGCVERLRGAGLKVWMLTGDKAETAINIGFACELLHSAMRQVLLTKTDPEAIRGDIAAALRRSAPAPAPEEGQDIGLIISGACLSAVFKSEELKARLYDLTCHCQSVVCCRVSPSQKAEVVALVRCHDPRAVTLAIGDGANDVSMIQAAHVGIGISGMEGQQAANSSDYAIAQFRFLFRLLFLHGRWNYRRLAKLFAYCFYKNSVVTFTQFLYCFVNGFTGQSLYDKWVWQGFNVFFAAIPVLVLGAFDRDLPHPRLLHEHAALYDAGRLNEDFNWQVFGGWFANALFHSCICFLVPLLATQPDILPDGHVYGLDATGVIMYVSVIWVVNLKLGLESESWTWLHHMAIWGSIAFLYLFLLVYGLIWEMSSSMYRLLYDLAAVPQFWGICALTVISALLRDIVYKYYCYNLKSPDRMRLHQRLRQEAQTQASSAADTAPQQRVIQCQAKPMQPKQMFVAPPQRHR